jgi:type 2 lantibiotic biosynthesis protein LanM
VIAAEHRDLHGGDIPAFTACPASADLWTSRGERIAGFFPEPSFLAVQRRIATLDEADLERQATLLQLSLGTQLLNRDRTEQTGWAASGGSTSAPPMPAMPAMSAAPAGDLRPRLLAAARSLGDRFATLALREGGLATWIGLEYRNKVWSLSPAPEDLYAGLPGIALFLGYLGETIGDAATTRLAREAVAALLSRVDAGAEEITNVGAFLGWGGILYTLVHLAVLWRDEELLAAAERIPERIAVRLQADEDLDVVGGAAGAVFGLLALHSGGGRSGGALATAVLCGERLLARARPAGAGLGWLTRLATEEAQIGFSHGNAGIGLALVELGAATGEARFTAAGLAAFAWEREAFWPELARWLERKDGAAPPPESTVAMAWCYGAPGIALSRLRALRHLSDRTVQGERQALESELAEALRLTAERGFGQSHCLCHGDLGNLDVLLEAAHRSGGPRRSARRTEVERLAAAALAGIERDGPRSGTRGGVESPGLMNGLAGIGYGLLRLADPDRVPSVLALAPPPG